MIEEKMTLTFSFLLCLVVFIIFNPLTVSSDPDPDPMARPTRPKAFTSADELKRYLDLVRDYYSLSGKARYGKRSKILPTNDYKNLYELLNLPINSNDMIKSALKNNHIIESLNKIHYLTPIDNVKSYKDINVKDRYVINDMIDIKNQDNQNNYQNHHHHQQQQQLREEKNNNNKKEDDDDVNDDEENENEDNDDDEENDNDRYYDLKKFQKYEKRDLPYLYEAMEKYYNDFQ